MSYHELIDTHCHIQSIGLQTGEPNTLELWAKAPELTADGVVTDALSAGINKMICVGCDLADSELAVEFASKHTGCYASIGIHPHEAAKSLADPATLPAFAALANKPRVAAVGECGLDYFYENSPREDQIKVLEFQLALAQSSGLPVILHVRESFDDFWPVFDNFGGNIRGVVHSFTDSKENLRQAIKRGLYIGVNGIVTFAKLPEQLEMYKAIPLERLVLETDAPFLTPVPFRGKINEPKQIKTVAEYLAGLRNESLDVLAQATTDNAHALFDL
jgi:TatD DNase family protein